MKKILITIIGVAVLLFLTYPTILRRYYKWQILNKSESYEFIDLYRSQRIKKIAKLPNKKNNLKTIKDIEYTLNPIIPDELYDYPGTINLTFLIAYVHLDQEWAHNKLMEMLKFVNSRSFGEVLSNCFYTQNLKLAKNLEYFYNDTSLGSTIMHVSYESAPKTEEERNRRRKNEILNHCVSVKDDALYATIKLLENRKISWPFHTELHRYPPEAFEFVKKTMKEIE